MTKQKFTVCDLLSCECQKIRARSTTYDAVFGNNPPILATKIKLVHCWSVAESKVQKFTIYSLVWWKHNYTSKGR
jgi:hypothetical protein